MNLASADALSARHRLQTGGWIARNAESFRHLPPPPAEVWLGDGAPACGCEAFSPLQPTAHSRAAAIKIDVDFDGMVIPEA